MSVGETTTIYDTTLNVLLCLLYSWLETANAPHETQPSTAVQPLNCNTMMLGRFDGSFSCFRNLRTVVSSCLVPGLSPRLLRTYLLLSIQEHTCCVLASARSCELRTRLAKHNPAPQQQRQQQLNSPTNRSCEAQYLDVSAIVSRVYVVCVRAWCLVSGLVCCLFSVQRAYYVLVVLIAANCERSIHSKHDSEQQRQL